MMLGKLMKYEFRSGLRVISIIWAAALGMSLIVGLMGLVLSSIRASKIVMIIMSIFEGVSAVLYGAIILAVIVATIIIIIKRFYHGLLMDEGYLMHTLPVSKTNLIISKGLVGGTILLISGIVIGLSILIIGLFFSYQETTRVVVGVIRYCKIDPVRILFGLEGLVLAILGILAEIYKVYAAMAIGQLANRHRVLLSVGAFLGLSAIEGIFELLLVAIAAIDGMEKTVLNVLENSSAGMVVQLAMLVIFIMVAIEIVVYHVITERLLTKKLNLL